MSPTDNQVIIACQAFLMAMVRESIKRNPNAAEHSVPAWDRMSATDRGVIMRSMKVALTGAYRQQAAEAKRQPTPTD